MCLNNLFGAVLKVPPPPGIFPPYFFLFFLITLPICSLKPGACFEGELLSECCLFDSSLPGPQNSFVAPLSAYMHQSSGAQGRLYPHYPAKTGEATLELVSL